MQFILIGILLNLVVGAAQAAGDLDGSLNTNNNNDATDSHNVTDSHNTTVNGDTYTGTVNQESSNKSVTQKIDTNQVGPAHLSNLTTSGADTCFGSQTGAVSLPGIGAFGGGKTVRDENCEMIKNTKLLASLGLKDAAVCLMFKSDKTIAESIAAAYPQLADLCDPKRAEQIAVAQAEKDRKAELMRYLEAGLEPPAHLYVPVNARSEDYKEVDFWINDEGEKCRREYIPFTNVQTTECR